MIIKMNKSLSWMTVFCVVASSAFAIDCPPSGFDSFDGLDLNEYSRARWFVQEQMPVTYLPESDNFCVTAQYVRNGKSKVSVFNYARRGGIDGELRFANLKAVVSDVKPSQLEVGPKFLPSCLYGPYWIIGVGSYSDANNKDKYEWALVSGGPPDKQSPNSKCRTGSGTNKSGLWILTRDPIVDESIIQKVRQFAESKGFDLTVLKRVTHTGCTYSF